MSNKQLLTHLIDKSEELDLLIIRLSLLEQSNRLYEHNPKIYDIQINKEKYTESIKKIKSMIELEKNQAKPVINKRNPLSDIPGGTTLIITRENGSVEKVRNIKFPKKYIDAVLTNNPYKIKSITDGNGNYWGTSKPSILA
jgi:hypothetical protein